MSTEADATFLSKLQSTRLPVWIPLVLAILALVLFLAWRMAVSSAEDRLEAERAAWTAQAAAEKAALLARANAAIAANSEAAHRLFGTSLAWAVRGELNRGNLGEVDQFIGELVRNERIQQVVLTDRDGRITLASDRKLVGARFAEHFPAGLLAAPEVGIEDGAEGAKNLAMPIQGLTSRLGSVLVVYTPEPALTE